MHTAEASCYPKVVLIALFLAAALLAQPGLGAVQRGQRLKGLRLVEQPVEVRKWQKVRILNVNHLQNDFGTTGQRMFYPNKMDNQFMAGPRMASWNDLSDPAEQFLSLKRASLLARLASQHARGFGRK